MYRESPAMKASYIIVQRIPENVNRFVDQELVVRFVQQAHTFGRDNTAIAGKVS
jgi:hypothetical protein